MGSLVCFLTVEVHFTLCLLLFLTAEVHFMLALFFVFLR